MGILGQDGNGKMYFHYLKPFPESQVSISQSLPLSMNERIFSEKECRPFFEGLLPDSEAARDTIAKRHGISARNSFRLLQAIGQDCPGAVSFHEIDEPIREVEFETLDVDFKTDEEIESYIKKLSTSNPLFHGIDDIRLSLAGVQNKAGIYVDPLNPVSEKIGIPRNGMPSTHILKPEIATFPNSAFNEYFCLTLAQASHLNAANVSFRKIGNTPCVIVQRYDRDFGTRYIKRLHQEDFCQALGKLPTQKYQNEGGPSLEDCFKLLNLIDRINFTKYIIFNFVVGNTDAHGKNFSILYGDHTPPKLAPLYDVLCCQIYEGHSQKMAMKIGGEYEAKNVFAKHWKEFCESVGLSFPEFKKEAQKMGKLISIAMDRVIQISKKYNSLSDEETAFSGKLRGVIQGNIDTLLERLKDK